MKFKKKIVPATPPATSPDHDLELTPESKPAPTGSVVATKEGAEPSQDTVLVTLQFKRTSPAYIDTLVDGQLVSFSRDSVLQFSVNPDSTVTMEVKKQYARRKGVLKSAS
jgi:hypothetical protein